MPVVGYEGYYSVSSLGRVRRDRGGSGARIGFVLKSCANAKGYCYVVLWRDGGQRRYSIHGRVAAAFLGQCPSGMEVNHKNGVKADNSVCNLEYVTRSQNITHAYQSGLRAAAGAKLTEPQVRRIKWALWKGDKALALSRQYGVHAGSIYNIAHGRTWRHVAA